jgi:hypothetical protein
MAHKCKQMKREEEFKSPVGQAAWYYYQLWLRAMKKLPPQQGASFMASKYFRTFINFTEFVRSVDLPRPERFIQLMVEKDFTPVMWMSDEVYTIYIEFLDRRAPPLEQAELSIKTLFKYAEKNQIDLSDFFDKVTPNELIQLVRSRRISPWLLLNTTKFKSFYANKTLPEQRIILENLIRPDYWGDKMLEHPEAIQSIKRLTSEMGI